MESADPRRSGELAGRRALVTGARGIGGAICAALADGGADRAGTYRRDEDAACELVREVESRGSTAQAYQVTMEDPDRCMRLAEELDADFGGVDIVVNSAGIASRGRSVVETDPKELDRVLRVHAFAPHFLLRAFLPQLRRHDRSDVVLVSSVITDVYGAGSAPYAMGKAAVEALAQCVAREELRHGVHVNVVAPGLVDTEMGRRLVRAVHGVELSALHAEYPFGHVCSPAEVADVVRFLVSDAARYVNNQRLVIDGGTFGVP